MRLLALCLLILVAGCSPEANEPPQTTTFLISGPETPAKEAIHVRRFEVTPETARRGETVTVNVELATPAAGRRLAIDWHAPDGWVIAHDVIDAEQTRTTEKAPVDEFEDAGRYRAVLRSGLESLAEDSVSVTE